MKLPLNWRYIWQCIFDLWPRPQGHGFVGGQKSWRRWIRCEIYHWMTPHMKIKVQFGVWPGGQHDLTVNLTLTAGTLLELDRGSKIRSTMAKTAFDYVEEKSCLQTDRHPDRQNDHNKYLTQLNKLLKYLPIDTNLGRIEEQRNECAIQ